MKANNQKNTSHQKTDIPIGNKTLYNTTLFNQTLNMAYSRHVVNKELNNSNIILNNSNLVYGNNTQQILRNSVIQEELKINQEKKQKPTNQNDYVRRRVNTSYFVYPIENNRKLSYHQLKEKNPQPQLLYRVCIPDVMKIPHLSKKNQIIKNQLRSMESRLKSDQENIRFTSRASFHLKPRSRIIRTSQYVNEQLKIIMDEHQSTEQSFINGWE